VRRTDVNARALALAIHTLRLACVAAALGTSACMCLPGGPWRYTESDQVLDIEPIAVGGYEFSGTVAFGSEGEIVIATGAPYTPLGTPWKLVARQPEGHRLLAFTYHGSRMVAVGEHGAIMVSDDGETWSPRGSGTTQTLRAVVGTWELLAVGDGVVVTSVDGDTWTLVDEPEGGWGSLRGAVATPSATWLVGDRGVAWSSARNRETWVSTGIWVAESLGTEDDLLGISDDHPSAHSSGQIIAASKTKVFLLVDGESTWRSITPRLDGEIIGLSDGVLLTSTGKMWVVESSGRLGRVPLYLDFEPTAIHAADNVVTVVGRGGHMAEIDYLPCKGRPLLDVDACIVAAAIERDDWQIGASSTSDGLDEREAERWRRAGLDEHASIASFAVHVLELISLGAPAELVLAVQQAMADEVRHAALSFDLARRFSGLAHGPGPLAIGPSVAARCGNAQAIALALFEQGCVGETLAACEADVDARTCADPAARAVLETIAADERRHAALAWSTLRWMLERDEGLREPLLRKLHELARVTHPPIHEATMRELVVPLAAQLFELQPIRPVDRTS
jgi:hypothetical protein